MDSKYIKADTVLPYSSALETRLREPGKTLPEMMHFQA